MRHITVGVQTLREPTGRRYRRIYHRTVNGGDRVVIFCRKKRSKNCAFVDCAFYVQVTKAFFSFPVCTIIFFNNLQLCGKSNDRWGLFCCLMTHDDDDDDKSNCDEQEDGLTDDGFCCERLWKTTTWS